MDGRLIELGWLWPRSTACLRRMTSVVGCLSFKLPMALILSCEGVVAWVAVRGLTHETAGQGL
jgi:hypothetical protein